MNLLSKKIEQLTGWQLAPARGILESRYFINALKFKVMPVCVFIRHKSDPFYSPEPDYIHEAMGHGLHL